MAAGSLWGMIPAFFKARWNTNETLFTLMLNYIAMQLVSFAIVLLGEPPSGSNHVGLINNQTKAGWLPSIGGNGYLLPIHHRAGADGADVRVHATTPSRAMRSPW